MSEEEDNIDIDAPDNDSNPNSPSKQSSSIQIDATSNYEGTQKDQALSTPLKSSKRPEDAHISSITKKRRSIDSSNEEHLKQVSDKKYAKISDSRVVHSSEKKPKTLLKMIPTNTQFHQTIKTEEIFSSNTSTDTEFHQTIESSSSSMEDLQAIPNPENIKTKSASAEQEPARESYNFTLIKPTLTGILDVELPQRKRATIPNSVSESDTPNNPEVPVSPSKKSQSSSKKRVFRKELLRWPELGTAFQIYGVYQLVDQGRLKKDKEGLQTALIIMMSYVKMNFNRLFPSVMEFERYEEYSRNACTTPIEFDLEYERERILQEKRKPYLQDFCSLLRCIRSDLEEFMQEAPTTDDLFDFLTRNLHILKERVVWYLTLKRRFSKVCEKCESFQEDIDEIEGRFNSWAQLFLLIILEISDFHKYYYPTE